MTVLPRGAVCLLFLVLAHSAMAAEQDAAEDDCNMLFVQDGESMTFDGRSLTLEGANPNMIFFCDRPERTAGHLTHNAFLELVSQGDNSFSEDPPNAAVSVFIGDMLIEVVVTLVDAPALDDGRMVFPLEIIEGQLPAAGGRTVLFIDPIGVPRSRTSVAGVHRRHVRQAVRRHRVL